MCGDKGVIRPAAGHHGREDLAGEHRWGDAGQLILLLVFLGIWIADSFFLHWTTSPARYVPVWVRLPAALAVFVLAWELARRGLRVVFGEVRERPAVVCEGVFARVRHPVYLGAILLYVGFVLATLSIASLAFLTVIVLFYHFISRHEEGLLLAKFGPEYEAYQQRVPMWIPRMKR
jgi:protein-S-isoprenylcysteine O-methyltransferase Ste14